MPRPAHVSEGELGFDISERPWGKAAEHLFYLPRFRLLMQQASAAAARAQLFGPLIYRPIQMQHIREATTARP
jgi:hypothetical protein